MHWSKIFSDWAYPPGFFQALPLMDPAHLILEPVATCPLIKMSHSQQKSLRWVCGKKMLVEYSDTSTWAWVNLSFQVILSMTLALYVSAQIPTSKGTRRCREVRGKWMSSSSYRGKGQADEGDLNAHGPKAHFMSVVIKRLTLNCSGVKFYTFADTPLTKLILLNFTLRWEKLKETKHFTGDTPILS